MTNPAAADPSITSGDPGETYDFLFDEGSEGAQLGELGVPAQGTQSAQGAQPGAQPGAAPAPAQYDSLIAQMQAQMQALQSQNALLTQQMMQPAQSSAAPAQHYQPRTFEAPVITMRDIEGALTPEQRELYRDFGPLLDTLTQLQSARYSAAITPLLNELDTLRAGTDQLARGVEQRLGEQSTQAFNATMAATLPEMAATVASPAWRNYLNEPVPLSGGRTVANVLMDAHGRRDLSQIHEIFNAFRQRGAASAKPPGVQPAAGTATAGPAGAVSAAMQQVQAGSGGVVSEAKIDELTTRFQRGLISHAAYTRAMDQLTELALTGAALK